MKLAAAVGGSACQASGRQQGEQTDVAPHFASPREETRSIKRSVNSKLPANNGLKRVIDRYATAPSPLPRVQQDARYRQRLTLGTYMSPRQEIFSDDEVILLSKPHWEGHWKPCQRRRRLRLGIWRISAVPTRRRGTWG